MNDDTLQHQILAEPAADELGGRPTGTDGPAGPAVPVRGPRGERPAGRDGTDPVAPSAAQQPLPFDADGPIPFALTARARRAVAPDRLPALRVVRDRTRPEGDPGDLDRVDQTRAARARALRRAGVGLAQIARELGADELLVRAWVGEPATAEAPATGDPPAVAAGDEDTGAGLLRAAAADDARRSLRADPAFAAGVGLVAGIVATDRHAVTMTTARPELAARVVAWLVEQAGLEPAQVRVVLRLGPRVAGDLARHRWAAELGVPVASIAATRWRAAPAPDAVEALLRIADPDLAATVAGWCDAVLDPDGGEPADAAF